MLPMFMDRRQELGVVMWMIRISNLTNHGKTVEEGYGANIGGRNQLISVIFRERKVF